MIPCLSTQVAGRILDRRYDVYGKDINTGIKLDSDVYNPVYEEKTEFREPNIPPTATLLLKVRLHGPVLSIYGVLNFKNESKAILSSFFFQFMGVLSFKNEANSLLGVPWAE